MTDFAKEFELRWEGSDIKVEYDVDTKQFVNVLYFKNGTRSPFVWTDDGLFGFAGLAKLIAAKAEGAEIKRGYDVDSMRFVSVIVNKDGTTTQFAVSDSAFNQVMEGVV